MESLSNMRESSGRFFNNHADSVYMLPADAEEASRLNEQHACLQSAIGRIVLPEISLGPKDSVLDAATGTGIWLLDCLAQSPPDVSFTGIDISPHLFPLSDQKPENAEFMQHSILALPETWSCSFSLVNHRLLIGALRVGEWPRVMNEYMRVLRPGGWVQLCEVFPRSTPGIWVNSALARIRGSDIDCAIHLEGWLRDAGFVNIHTTVRSLALGPATQSPNYTKLHVAIYKSMKDAVLRVGIIGSSEEYDMFLSDLQAEVESSNESLPFYWVWAQRPKDSSQDIQS